MGDMIVKLVVKGDSKGLVVAFDKGSKAQKEFARTAKQTGTAVSGQGQQIAQAGQQISRTSTASLRLVSANMRMGQSAKIVKTAVSFQSRKIAEAGKASSVAARHAAAFARKNGQITRTAKSASNAVDRYRMKAKQAGNQSRKLANDNEKLISGYGRMRGAIAALGLGLLARKLFNTGAQMEGIENAMSAATGGMATGAKEIGFVRDQAERLGLEFQSTVGDYTKLAAATKGTALEGEATRNIFLGVAEASTVMRLSADDTSGALRALNQIASKGKVQAEELRGQLGERLPGAFQIAARAMGKNTAELSKMLELGQVMSDDFLPKFAAELRKTFKDGLPAAVRSATAETNRFKNAMFDLQVEFSASGFLSGVTSGFKALTVTLRDPEIKEGIAALGKNIGAVTGFAAENIGAMSRLVVGITAARVATRLFSSSTLGSAGAIVGLRMMATMSKTAAVGMIAMGAASRIAAAGATVLRRALTLLGGPIGLIVLAGEAIYQFASRSEDATTATDRYRTAMDQANGVLKTGIENAKAMAAARREEAIATNKASVVELQYARARLATRLAEQRKEEAELGTLDPKLAKRYGIDKLTKRRGGQADATRDEIAKIDRQLQSLLDNIQKLGKPIEIDIQPKKSKAGATATDNIYTDRLDALKREEAQLYKLYRARAISKDLYDITKQSINAENKVREIANASKKKGIVLTDAERAALKKTMLSIEGYKSNIARTSEIEKKHVETINQIKEAQLASLPAYDQAIAKAKKWRDEALKGLDPVKAGYKQFAAEIDEIFRRQIKDAQDQQLRDSKDWSDGVKRALSDLNDDYSDHATNAENALKKASRGAEDSFVNMIKGTETVSDAFSNMVDMIIDDMLRMVYQQTIAKPLNSFLGGIFDSFGGLFGGGNSGPTGTPGYGGANPVRPGAGLFSWFEKGGIMTPQGELPVRTYRKGGVANSPQVSIWAEGDMNEANVPLPDGRRIPVDLRGAGGGTVVQIIDQRSGDAAAPAVSQQQGADGQAITRIILSKVADGIASGALDAPMQQAYGVRRQGAGR